MSLSGSWVTCLSPPFRYRLPVTKSYPSTVKAARNYAAPGESITFTVTAVAQESDRLVSGYIAITTDYPGKKTISEDKKPAPLPDLVQKSKDADAAVVQPLPPDRPTHRC